MAEPVILLVERDTRTLELLHAILRRFHPGLRVLTTDSAEKAVDLLAENEVDLLACDYAGGGRDDRWLRERVRGTRRIEGIPILFLSRQADAPPNLDDRDFHLAKPFSALSLVDKIDEILDAGGVVGTMRSGASRAPTFGPGSASEPPPTTIIRTKFAEVMEGIKVRITQMTNPAVPEDLIKRHLLFSRAIETYRIKEHFLRSGDEVHFQVMPSEVMPGFNELRFEVVVKDPKGVPDRRVPVMPEFLLARSKDEITVEGEIDRVTRFVLGRYLSQDVSIPAGSLIGNEFTVSRVRFPAGWQPRSGAVDLSVRFTIEPATPATLAEYWSRVTERVRGRGASGAEIKKTLIEAVLGLEDLASRVPEARARLSKAALYLSALVLLLQDHWSARYAPGSCEKVHWAGNDPRLDGSVGAGGQIVFDDPVGRVVYDETRWFELMDAYSSGGPAERDFDLPGVEVTVG